MYTHTPQHTNTHTGAAARDDQHLSRAANLPHGVLSQRLRAKAPVRRDRYLSMYRYLSPCHRHLSPCPSSRTARPESIAWTGCTHAYAPSDARAHTHHNTHVCTRTCIHIPYLNPTQTLRKPYGQTGSNYQGQSGPKLAKYFATPTEALVF